MRLGYIESKYIEERLAVTQPFFFIRHEIYYDVGFMYKNNVYSDNKSSFSFYFFRNLIMR